LTKEVIESKIMDMKPKASEALRSIGLRDGMTVLDFGCGTGNYTIAAAKLVGKKGRVYALDIDQAALEEVKTKFRREGLQNITIICGDEEIALANESIDVILLYDVIHLVKGRENLIKRLHKMLKSNGLLSVFPHHHFEREEIIKLITQNGLFMLVNEDPNNNIYNFKKYQVIYEERIPSDMELKAKKAIGKSFEPSVIDRSILVTFPYEYPYRPIQMEHTTYEFTCVCPFNELPDYATITIKYVPNKLCIELKSLKYYLYSFRQVRMFHEHVVNKILEDLVAVLDPLELTVEGKFAVRGGIATTAKAYYSKDTVDKKANKEKDKNSKEHF